MEFQHITFEKLDDVARLTLNKPPLNVLDIAMMREINAALEELDGDAPALSKVEGPALSKVEGPALSKVEGKQT